MAVQEILAGLPWWVKWVAIPALVLLVFGVAGHSALSGPELFGLSRTHGVHRDDLIVVAAWALGLWCAWRLSRR